MPVSAIATKTGAFTKRLKFLRALAEQGRDQAVFVVTNPEPAHWPTGPPEDLLLGTAE